MTGCRSTHDNLACCRLHAHPMPHMDPSGQQWDEKGLRGTRRNDPYKGEVR